VSPIFVHNHQAAVFPLSLPLPGALTYAHINNIDDHRKGEDHTQTYNKRKGKQV